MGAKSVRELKLVGGHRALDLVNTVHQRVPGHDQGDYLATPGDLLIFSGRAGLANAAQLAEVEAAWAASPHVAARALAAVREIREALHAVLSARLSPGVEPGESSSELEHLSLACGAAASRSRLVVVPGDDARPGAPSARWASVAPPALLLQDLAAVAAVDLLTETDVTRLGRCDPAAGGCGWLFLDHTRNRSRRWCTMEDCGAEVKSKRLTEKRRADRESARH